MKPAIGRIRWLHVLGWTCLLGAMAALALLRWTRGHARDELPPESGDC